jgi:hypothetical protein
MCAQGPGFSPPCQKNVILSGFKLRLFLGNSLLCLDYVAYFYKMPQIPFGI